MLEYILYFFGTGLVFILLDKILLELLILFGLHHRLNDDHLNEMPGQRALMNMFLARN
jgi:hypothetical protein